MSVADPNITHAPPCDRCKTKEMLCRGLPGHQCIPCKVARGKCNYATSGRSASKKAPSITSTTGVAGGSRLSAPGPVCHTVSSPEPWVPESIVLSDDELAEKQIVVKRCPIPAGKGKKMVVEVEDDGVDLEDLHQLHQACAEFTQANGLILSATNRLDRLEQRLLKRIQQRK